MFDSSCFDPRSVIPLLAGDAVQPALQKKHKKHLRLAAVLVPIIKVESEWSLLFTRRSDRLKKHSGQVAFPGGSADESDGNLAETALRESWEEIALPSKNVEVLGYLHPFEANSGFSVTPVVGWVHTPFKIIPSEAEVARVFTVPITWLLEPAHLQLRSMETPWERRDNVVFYERYDDELVWGFTGWITMEFMQLLASI